MNGLKTVTLYDKFIIITDTTKQYFSGKGSYIYVTYSKYKPNLKKSRQYAKQVDILGYLSVAIVVITTICASSLGFEIHMGLKKKLKIAYEHFLI